MPRKDEKSLRQDVGFTSIAHTKTVKFLIYTDIQRRYLCWQKKILIVGVNLIFI